MSSGGPAYVIVVEPNALLRRSYVRMARQLGVALAAAASGEEALLLADPVRPPSLVISAYRLPGMNGLQLLSRIRAGHPRTLAVLSSGAQVPVEAEPGIAVLPKPVDVATFGQLVERATRGRDEPPA